MRRFLLASLAAAALIAAIPSGASAATQIGETFTPDDDFFGFDVTLLQGRSPGGQYAAPTAGVITRWSFEADASPPDLKFKVGRRGFGSNFTIIGESALVTDLAAGTLNSRFVRIPVLAGDVIGFFNDGSGNFLRAAEESYEVNWFTEDVEPGTSEDFNEFSFTQLDVSALLEPDCDNDGLGDETQDGNLSSCGLQLQPRTCKGQRLTIVGTPGNDEIVGTDTRDVIAGLDGNDEIFGLDSRDIICGNEGKDSIKGQGGNDVLKGNRGADLLKGGSGNDKLKGNRGRDRLRGGNGDDVCGGGKGDDSARRCEVEKSI